MSGEDRRKKERDAGKEAEKQPDGVYEIECGEGAERASQHQIYELRGPWLTLRGVYVSKIQI